MGSDEFYTYRKETLLLFVDYNDYNQIFALLVSEFFVKISLCFRYSLILFIENFD